MNDKEFGARGQSKPKNLERLDYESPVATDVDPGASEYQAFVDSLKSKINDQGEPERSDVGIAQQNPPSGDPLTTEQRDVIMQSMIRSMSHMGGTGREILFGILYKRYGVVKQDVVDSPRKFMNALRIYMGSTALVLERQALDEIEERLKVSASSLVEAIAIMRGITSSEDFLRKAGRKSKAAGKAEPFHLEYHSTGQSPRTA